MNERELTTATRYAEQYGAKLKYHYEVTVGADGNDRVDYDCYVITHKDPEIVKIILRSNCDPSKGKIITVFDLCNYIDEFAK